MVGIGWLERRLAAGGRGWPPSGLASPLECCAAQSRQVRPDAAQEPSSDSAEADRLAARERLTTDAIEVVEIYLCEPQGAARTHELVASDGGRRLGHGTRGGVRIGITQGYSLRHIGLQRPPHRAAASITKGDVGLGVGLSLVSLGGRLGGALIHGGTAGPTRLCSSLA